MIAAPFTVTRILPGCCCAIGNCLHAVLPESKPLDRFLDKNWKHNFAPVPDGDLLRVGSGETVVQQMCAATTNWLC
jgi:hypothetical protein